ncbi:MULTISPECIES: DUF2339 domain-containing protein [unclassified Pseudoalteromonas]|uniref:DUF2339 domain-containing protein n=1 Tax=unclassified Pseudoalteromonas TaxID=194690 RepID=UPI0025B3FFD5|nr:MULTISPECIES: DUF2339 domain-containing protein [unclassified Pseudoalteromonas]MDN3378903.1 DUF2339 domain-containing protein [Pseudoalteromonas sp. APC 3893]MDN3387549.1 DUF2339 domain-containing protein [Pseudoalteromonas sp. APC 4017]
MDDVLGLIVILSLVVVIGSIAGLIALTKVSALQQEVTLLKKQLHSVISKTSSQPATAVARFASEQSHTPPIESELQSHATNQQSVTLNQTISTHTVISSRETNKRSHSAVSTFLAQLKNQLQQNWMTWIGGVALAFGGIFLAKYSLDAGLLSPSLRLTLGGLFGIALITVADFLHRKGIVFEGFNNYIPAALAGGGFISCFALTLLAYSSYEMLSATTAFVMLAVIALAASSMALRLGPLLALLGIVGAYSVPIWVNTGSGNLAALLTYIGFVTLSAVLVAKRVNRNWLWYLLWAGHIGWYWVALSVVKSTEYWLVGGFSLLSIIGLIAMMRLGLTLRLLECRPHSLQRLLKLQPDNPLLLAIVAPLLIAIAISMASMQWQIMMVCLIVMLLFLVLQNSRWDLWQGLALLIAVLLVVTQHNYNIDSNDHLFIFKDMYGLGLLLGIGFCLYGLYFGTYYYKRLSFHLVAAFSLFVLIATLYTLTSEQELAVAYSLWTVLLLLGSGVLIKRAQNAYTQWQQFSYWIGANANITLCLTMLLADSGLTLALAIQVLVISFLVKRHKVPMPHWPIKALVAAVLARLTFAPWIESYADLTLLSMHWSIVVYPIAVGLFWFVAKQWQQTDMKLWLEGAALHCLALFITTETSYQLVGHYPQLGSLSFYEQVLLSCNWLALGCVYLYRAQSAAQLAKLYQVAGLILSALAGLLLLSTALNDNPLLTSLYVGETPIFNWVLLMWLVPSALALWLTKLVKPVNAQLSKIILAVAGVLAVLAITVLIRQYWQGAYIYLDKITSDAELYSYSIIWLFLGAPVVIWGHLEQQLLLQKVGLGILGAVIVKVFLIDMANLTGLLKAISFIGLGLSLVGLSWLFQKLRSKALSG